MDSNIQLDVKVRALLRLLATRDNGVRIEATKLEVSTDADRNCLLTPLFRGAIAVAQLLRPLQKM